MSRTRDREDFLFCDLCGSMLDLKSLVYANCRLCHFRKSTKGQVKVILPEIAGREISYQVTAQDIRRALGISCFAEGKLKLATIERLCDKCGNKEFEYTRKQLRSADEGQTTFLTCTKCRDTVVEN